MTKGPLGYWWTRCGSGINDHDQCSFGLLVTHWGPGVDNCDQGSFGLLVDTLRIWSC